MTSAALESVLANYHWQLSLLTFAGIMALTFVGGKVLTLFPTFKAAAQLNKDAFAKKMALPRYAANQKMNRGWGLIFIVAIFGLILPFCLTAAPQPWWKFPLDIVVILMVYDFFYYLTHRFLFHANGVTGGPLVWMHATHHQQLNPCRWDGSYINPLEVAIGLGLFVGTTFMLSRFMGDFHVVTVIFAWVAFSEINQHNHDRWTVDRFPFRYLNTMSVMHHNHHAKFTGGNFATISLLYDWMFGTLDYGDAPKKAATAQAAETVSN